MPDWVRDYVLIHELMHLKRMDHSREVLEAGRRGLPEDRDARAWLRRLVVRTFRSANPRLKDRQLQSLGDDSTL